MSLSSILFNIGQNAHSQTRFLDVRVPISCDNVFKNIFSNIQLNLHKKKNTVELKKVPISL